jgi:hypothetical protein
MCLARQPCRGSSAPGRVIETVRLNQFRRRRTNVLLCSVLFVRRAQPKVQHAAEHRRDWQKRCFRYFTRTLRRSLMLVREARSWQRENAACNNQRAFARKMAAYDRKHRLNDLAKTALRAGTGAGARAATHASGSARAVELQGDQARAQRALALSAQASALAQASCTGERFYSFRGAASGVVAREKLYIYTLGVM